MYIVIYTYVVTKLCNFIYFKWKSENQKGRNLPPYELAKWDFYKYVLGTHKPQAGNKL